MKRRTLKEVGRIEKRGYREEKASYI